MGTPRRPLRPAEPAGARRAGGRSRGGPDRNAYFASTRQLFVSLHDAAAGADAPFADLPQAMVREMLGSSRGLAGGLASDISSMRSMRGSVRESLAPLLGRDSDLPRPESPPSTAGVDGSHCAERMLATDIVAMGAVAVEGLEARRPAAAGAAAGAGPAARLWPRPRHFVHVESLAHDDANPVAARAVMAAMEVQLASVAPHDVVFVDGSLATPAIALDIALRQRSGGPPSLARYLEEGEGGKGDGEVRFGPIERTLSGYLRMLAPACGGGDSGGDSGGATRPAPPPGRTVAAVAKYSQRSEICERLGLPNLDDRGLLSLVLEPGEYVGPFAPWRQAGRSAPGASGGRLLSGRIPGGARARSLAEAIADAVKAVRVLYYRPHAYSPAIRLEVGGFGAGDAGDAGAAGDAERTGALLEAVRLQSAGPGLMEPYPVYMADRMARSLPRALPAVRGIAVSAMARTWGAAPGADGGPEAPGGGMGVAELYIAARGYRT